MEILVAGEEPGDGHENREVSENTVRMTAEAIGEFSEKGHCVNTVNAGELERS